MLSSENAAPLRVRTSFSNKGNNDYELLSLEDFHATKTIVEVIG